MIFVATARDPTALFFSISVSPSEDKITIVDAPHYLLPNLETTIRSFFPRKIASCRYTEDQVYKVELKRSFGGKPFRYVHPGNVVLTLGGIRLRRRQISVHVVHLEILQRMWVYAQW